MAKKNRAKAVDFDDSKMEILKNPSEAAAYLNAHLEEDGPNKEKYFLRALKNVARAHGVSHLAEKAELWRRTIYKVLSGDTVPRLDTLTSILNAMDLSITITRKSQSAKRSA